MKYRETIPTLKQKQVLWEVLALRGVTSYRQVSKYCDSPHKTEKRNGPQAIF